MRLTFFAFAMPQAAMAHGIHIEDATAGLSWAWIAWVSLALAGALLAWACATGRLVSGAKGQAIRDALDAEKEVHP